MRLPVSLLELLSGSAEDSANNEAVAKVGVGGGEGEGRVL